MEKWLVRTISVLLVVATVGGCAYYLRPEQRGNTSGPVDGAMLAADILWLIPGIIPGVVALTVDFTSGAIRKEGVRPASRYVPVARNDERVLAPGSQVIIRRPVVDRASTFEVRLVSQRGRLLARAGEVVLPGQVGRQPLTLELPKAAPDDGKAELQLIVNGELRGRVPCVMQ